MRKYFVGVQSLRDLEQRYKEYIKTLHPDKGGSPEEYVQMKREYERLRIYFEEKEQEGRKVSLLDVLELIGEVATLIKQRL